METVYGILIPFLGTSLGAACVFFMKHSLSDRVQRSLTGFASGVMVAASIWSLLIPALEQSAAMGTWQFIPAAAGFWIGILFLLLLDRTIPHLHQNSEAAEGPGSNLQRTTMMILAVTLHNIPEGMAVGVVYAGYRLGNSGITAAGALALSLGIAIQNFPEGAIISMPLRARGNEKIQSLCRRSAFRHCRTDRCSTDHSGIRLHCPCVTLSAQLCSWCHALCRGRGTHSGNVSGRTLQSGNHLFCSRIQYHDDSGRSPRISILHQILIPLLLSS